MSNLPKNDFDQVAVVVDWLDACRRHDIKTLLALYAPDASLACECDGNTVHRGRVALQAYWRPLLDAASSPGAFGLEEIVPAADGVELDYLNGEGKPVRIHFTFDTAGKILRTRCIPRMQSPAPDDADVRDRA